nr:NAD(P)-binding domain-containing protein [Sphingobacterium sp. E70]
MSENTTAPYDIIIVGGGPIGLACALEAKQANLNYLILEKGCLVNSLYNYPQNMTFFSSSERLEIGDIPFVTTNPKPRRTEALEYYRRIQQKFELDTHLFEEVLDIKKTRPKTFMSQQANVVTQQEKLSLLLAFMTSPCYSIFLGKN